jgi:hypothetical protein
MISWFAPVSISRRMAAPLRRRWSCIVHRVKNAAGLFFLEVQIAVAGDAERGGRNDFVSAIEALGEGVDDVVEEYIFDGGFGGRPTYQARQACWGDNCAEGAA